MNMQKLILIILLVSSLPIYSQNKETNAIMNEGRLLFRLELGSWYGTDDALARFRTKRDSIGGYLSYVTSDNKISTIFFSRFDANNILIRYEFDSLPKPEVFTIDTIDHKASDLEKSLISIRIDAADRAFSNSDNFFTFYKESTFNFIPVISGKEKNVFILTGPQVSGVVLIGNDYKLSYDKNNDFIKEEKIHNSLLQIPYSTGKEDAPTVATIHTHLVTEYISSTDICTLLLYKNFVEWNQHIVMSENQVSIFDLKKETLFTMKRKAWDKIYKD